MARIIMRDNEYKVLNQTFNEIFVWNLLESIFDLIDISHVQTLWKLKYDRDDPMTQFLWVSWPQESLVSVGIRPNNSSPQKNLPVSL